MLWVELQGSRYNKGEGKGGGVDIRLHVPPIRWTGPQTATKSDAQNAVSNMVPEELSALPVVFVRICSSVGLLVFVFLLP